MMQQKYNWSYEEKTQEEFLIVLRFNATQGQFNRLLKKTLSKLQRKHQISVQDADPDVIERFDIPESQKRAMFPLILRAVGKNVNYVVNEIKKDKLYSWNKHLKIISYDITRVEYVNHKSKGWNIIIDITGFFAEENVKK